MHLGRTIPGTPEIVGNTAGGAPGTVVVMEVHTNEVVTQNIYKGVEVHESTWNGHFRAPYVSDHGF